MNFLTHFRISDNIITNTRDFINRLKKERISKNHKKILLDMKRLFKNVYFDETKAIITRKIYDKG